MLPLPLLETVRRRENEEENVVAVVPFGVIKPRRGAIGRGSAFVVGITTTPILLTLVAMAGAGCFRDDDGSGRALVRAAAAAAARQRVDAMTLGFIGRVWI
jgi:hypothetical protein